ncbi:MAG TPA: hypothetical protein VJ464_06940 [Blastocatellia bacterium]|nr:hypothetical protein [Blastocatellia bacterium]
MAETEKITSDRVRSFETLAGFLDQLRRRDYSIGIGQYIAVHRLLLHLFDSGEWPDDPKALAPWLAPILCSSPEDQEGFYEAFSDWVDSWQGPRASRLTPSRPAEPTAPPAPVAARNRRALILKVGIGVSAVLALAAVLLLVRWSPFPFSPKAQLIPGGAAVTGRFNHLERLSTSVGTWARGNSRKPSGSAPSPVLAPIPRASPGPSTISLRPEGLLILKRPDTPLSTLTSNRLYRRIAATALPCLFIAGVMLWGAIRRLQLKRNYTRRTPPLEQLRVKGLAERFFNRTALRAAAQQLRRHRLTSVRELAVEATIFETTRRAGWFTPIYTPRRALPEYLVLTDRASQSDHQALLDDELIKQLSDYDVILTRYYFNGDPRICRQAPGSPALRLETLEALHPNHGLLIFSDGAHLIHPLTQRPQSWLDLFAAWPERALFMHLPPDEWDSRESALEELGFTILPATEEGIVSFVRVLQTGRAPRVKGSGSPLLYPETLRSDPDRWVEDEMPPTQEAEMLRVELQYYLGLEGYYWLAACALYPRVQWGITLFLGQQLTDHEGFNQRLLALARLPWFRHGTMPEWLRTGLVMSLPAEQERKIRKALDRLLLSALENPQGFDLELASALTEETSAPPRGVVGRMLGRIKDRIREIRNQHSRRAFLNAAPTDSPLRDYVFLSFLSGQKPERLAINFPKRLRRLLFPGGHSIRGVRPLILLLMAGLLSIVGWSAFPTATPPQTPPPDFTVQPTAGTRGESLTIEVTNTRAGDDCATYNLNEAALTGAAGSGITVVAVDAEDCRMAAQVNIASDAPTGTTELTIKKGDTNIGSFPFRVAEQPFPQLSYMPNQGTQGGTVTLTISGDDKTACAANSLKTASISVPPGSGITISDAKTDDCGIAASLRIDPNAPVGMVNLTLSRGGLTAQVPFTITKLFTARQIPPRVPTAPVFTSTIPPQLKPGDRIPITISVKGCNYDLSKATLTVERAQLTRAIFDVAVGVTALSPCRLSANVTVDPKLPPIGGVLFQLKDTKAGPGQTGGIIATFASTVTGSNTARGRLLVRFQNVGAQQGDVIVDLRPSPQPPGGPQPMPGTLTKVSIAKQNQLAIDDLPYGNYRLTVAPLTVTPRSGPPLQVAIKIDRESVTQIIDAAALLPTSDGGYPIRLEVTGGARAAANPFQDEKNYGSMPAFSRLVTYQPEPTMSQQSSSQVARYQVTVKAFDVKTDKELQGISIYYFPESYGSANAARMTSPTPATVALPSGVYVFFAAEGKGVEPGKQLSAYTKFLVGK